MSDRERLALAIGLVIGALLGTVGWWLHFLIIRAAG